MFAASGSADTLGQSGSGCNDGSDACTAVKKHKMLFSNRPRTTTEQPLNLFTVGCLQRPEHGNVTGLELVRGMRWQSTEDDVVLVAECHDIEGLVGSEAVTDQYARLTVGRRLCQRVEDVLDSMHVYSVVGVTTLCTSEVPPGRRMGCPMTSVRRGRPYHERMETVAGRRYTLDRCYQRALRAGFSVVTQLVRAYQNLERPKLPQEHSRLVHVVHVLGQHIRAH
jgi:hypothetical protein